MRSRFGKRAAAASTRSRMPSEASSIHATATRRSPRAGCGAGSNSGTSASSIATHSATVRAIGPAWS